MRKILLLSTSTVHGTGYLDHAVPSIEKALVGITKLLFVPYAIQNQDAYAKLVRERFEKLGIDVTSLHDVEKKVDAVEKADALFVGGGNSFRLLKALYRDDLLDVVRRRVASGMPYMGSSAGTNMACPTMRTTNDMPIVSPPSMDAFGLIPFQINPHYLDKDPNSEHMGETREQRIREYHEENDTPVLGLREGAIVRVSGGAAALEGVKGARLFRKGEEPLELEVGAPLTFLLGED